MIDKQDFYKGVAVLRAIDDPRCLSIIHDTFGFVVNSDRFFMVKYTTKNRSPWRFTITTDEFGQLQKLQCEHVVIVFVCGGDGICAAIWPEIREVLGNEPGWISARRAFGGWYKLAGRSGELGHKVSLRSWPSSLFDSEVEREI